MLCTKTKDGNLLIGTVATDQRVVIDAVEEVIKVYRNGFESPPPLDYERLSDRELIIIAKTDKEREVIDAVLAAIRVYDACFPIVKGRPYTGPRIP